MNGTTQEEILEEHEDKDNAQARAEAPIHRTGATFLYADQDLLQPPSFKESAAKSIAERLVTIFGIAVLGSLGFGFFLVLLLALGWTHQPSPNPEAFIKEGAVPLITTIATFASTVFAPLLAFILGYYFGEKRGKP